MRDPNDDTLPDYMTSFYDAVSGRDFVSARALVDAGHTLDQEPSDDGYTLLHRAVQQGDVDAVQFLVTAGCVKALNMFDYVQHTPLIWAAEEGWLEIARILIDAGADVNAHNAERIGNTAIREAVRAGDLRMVELLLSAGANPTIRGWMQVDAVFEAKIQLKEKPSSEVRQKILAVLEGVVPPTTPTQ